MALVDGLSKARMLAIEAQSVVDGEVVGDNLILTRHDGSTSDAGSVRGPSTPDATAATPDTLVKRDAEGDVAVHDISANDLTLAGKADISGVITALRLRLTGTTDASASSTLHALQIGVDSGQNMIMDGNEIQARDNGVGKRVYMEYGANTDSAVYTPTDPGDFVHRKYSDTNRRGALGQRLLFGGGIRKVTSTGISWSQRLMVMGAGRVSGSTAGYWEITMPPDGTVIPMYGSTGGANVLVAGGVIPLSSWRALYYELPLTGNNASQAANFRVMDYNAATTQEIPGNWILIATRNVDTLIANYLWGDGRVQDYWKALTLTNSWVAYGLNFPVPGWRWTPEGKVELRGLMKSGTVGLATPFSTLPYPEMAPEGVGNAGSIFIVPASAGSYSARMDVLPDGRMAILALGTGATNSFVALENVSWHPAGH